MLLVRIWRLGLFCLKGSCLFFKRKTCCGSACGLSRFVGRGGIAAPEFWDSVFWGNASPTQNSRFEGERV